MHHIILKIKAGIYRRVARLFGYRPVSYPYISGDGFRAIADHIFDETTKCHAEDIEEGDVIFLKSDMLDEWFGDVHSRIKARYRLITHNSDKIIGEKEARLIDEKIIHWYAQNNIHAHPRITPIPIGIENHHHYMSGWMLEKCLQKLLRRKIEKKKRILFGFTAHTHVPERRTALEALRKNPLADEITKRLNDCSYFELLHTYAYVASPPGNGPDCHRTWEALYLGASPIVRKDRMTQYYKELGLDICVIDSWDHIELGSNIHTSSSALYFDFWRNLIKNHVS